MTGFVFDISNIPAFIAACLWYIAGMWMLDHKREETLTNYAIRLWIYTVSARRHAWKHNL